jgi:hypothetical protein
MCAPICGFLDEERFDRKNVAQTPNESVVDVIDEAFANVTRESSQIASSKKRHDVSGQRKCHPLTGQ